MSLSLSWIEAEKRMPAVGEQVLVVRQHGIPGLKHPEFFDVATWDGKFWRAAIHVCLCNDVSHWQPMPFLPYEIEVRL